MAQRRNRIKIVTHYFTVSGREDGCTDMFLWAARCKQLVLMSSHNRSSSLSFDDLLEEIVNLWVQSRMHHSCE